MVTRVVPSVCCHDCGGSCPLNIYVENERIVKIEARDLGIPALRPCARGLLYHYRVHHPDRLQYPMKRAGERGEGKFVRISWDEALSEIAAQLTRIRDIYGPAAIFNQTMSGSLAQLHSLTLTPRFLNMAGGHGQRWGGASFQGGFFGSMATYGRTDTGNDRADLLNSRMIFLWGCNPAESIFSTETRWYLLQAKERGTRIVCVDPRLTETASTLASQWVPIRPGTDAAMLVAMAYVILEHGLQDQAFLDKHTVGFDMFRDYVTGEEEGIAKTPEWAEKITGVPAATIRQLALEYATSKPAAILAGWAPGRTSRGEQYHRLTATLQAMTGNIGLRGGAAAGLDMNFGILPVETTASKDYSLDIYGFILSMLSNPVSQDKPLHEYAVEGIRDHTIDRVNFTKIWDAELRGKVGGYYSDIKMTYIAGGNPICQAPMSNQGAQALKKLEFVVVHEMFLTPTAKFADILLPVCSWCERNDIRFAWMFGHYAMYANKAIEPLYETKTDLQIFTELASKLGIHGYNDRTEDEWLQLFAAQHGIPDYEAFKANSFHKQESPEPWVTFQSQIKEPERYPFPTPSGKIEIYCQRIADFNRHEALPPIPKYVEGWEGVNDALAEQYPLQLITTHPPKSVHSQYQNIPWVRDIEPHAVWINPLDAKARNIRNGDRVKVFNDRGIISLAVKVTSRIMPGVVCIYEGAWYAPDASGVDQGGCANVLIKGDHSPGGALCSNSALVQIEKA
ncbi:MAG: molybdopterin-dependent oxidoreductase [Chloroflexi bacterium]|nr:molybdopterin-dependent oxidoreductase [Chloroflexota bacterium]